MNWGALGLSAVVLMLGCGSSSETGSKATGGSAGSLGQDAGSDAATAGGTAGAPAGGSAGQGGSGNIGGSATAGSGGNSGAGASGSGGGDSGGSGGAAGTVGAAGAGGDAGASGSAGMSSGGSGSAPYCGDGIRNQAAEDCDGSDHAGATCASLRGANWGGALQCTAGCAFDTSGCQCAPDCSGGKNCGSNGCSGSCGSCAPGSTCNGGHCSCTPNCAGKQCGDNGCGGSCGSCSGGTTCSAGQCQLAGGCNPATTCPTQTPKSSNAQYCLSMNDYNQCVYCPQNCGAPKYGYQCSSGGGPPGVSGCVNTGGGAWCCPTASCMRATPWDTTCANMNLPPVSYTCHLSASVPAGCVSHAPGYYCCPS